VVVAAVVAVAAAAAATTPFGWEPAPLGHWEKHTHSYIPFVAVAGIEDYTPSAEVGAVVVVADTVSISQAGRSDSVSQLPAQASAPKTAAAVAEGPYN
jgi:hypothetical protein